VLAPKKKGAPPGKPEKPKQEAPKTEAPKAPRVAAKPARA